MSNTKFTFSSWGPLVVQVVLVLITGCQTPTKEIAEHTTWSHYGGSPDQSKFFESPSITKSNVGEMELLWNYPSGDDRFYFFNPIIVDSTMFVLGKNSSLIAIHARTGKELWIHTDLSGITRRGINYWESGDKKDRRLLFTLNNSLQAIDAVTGKSIMDFGDNGYVDLREGLDRDPTSVTQIQSMMPGVVYDDLLILGSAPGESYFSPPGHVRAYNVVTGKLEWTFHTIPRPGEYGYETWPKDAYKYVGGVNVWSEISVDTERGIAYLPIGSPTYDYYGGDRLGSNLFANSLVAVDAKTGERLWHYQTVHHDLWDYDLSPAPQLLTVDKDGKKVDAVAIATKHGFVFVFDRVTGEPIFPIEEKPFPKSEMPGEESWPTQPITSLPSFTRHEVTEENLNPYFSDSLRQDWLKRLDSTKSGLYEPPSDKYETIIMPGALGGANYGNTAGDPQNGMLYILTQEYASIYRLNKLEPTKKELTKNDVDKVRSLYESSCIACHGPNMEGGAGPSLKNLGHHMFYEEFRNTVVNGKGVMPGLVHVDETSLKALFQFLGGDPERRSFRRGEQQGEPIDGPVVASGGVIVPPDVQRGAPMQEYPQGVEHPETRYTTDYGLDWPGLIDPPWSSIIAYDLNEGTIKWRQPVGVDSLYVQGDKTKGAPNGTQRKGMVITSTGIVFSTAKGGKVYAFDAENGNVLWETTLSHETNAQPSMFSLDGKEYLVINATSDFRSDSYDHSKKPGAVAKGYLVYGIPDKE
ncbi:quinoprotein glucose dehydrogenase [Flagellimonas taeanensis]|uniref:outer membrane protein assembly factor BamB family protein n=1 Tax=Flavobacteriaceae TaxID=49546 RepID=UPI000E6A235F|nr:MULTISPECIES: PQQ-binding-like beta-propeller repeat protein [Allomuricauda]MDC6386616.1 PQQ-binding-like beta-propeller repeat protein [Muricauda sp. SK9]RIV51331.1 quinoprotein glucose dehydrogenase [Allomuricauda taeanensis]